MSYIVCADCTGKIPKRYDDGVCKPITKKSGSVRALFMHCSVGFAVGTGTEITDTTAEAANVWYDGLVAVDPTILVTPSYGKVVVSEGASEVLINLGASMDVLDQTEHTFEIMCPSTAVDYDAVEDWFQKLYENHASYKLNWFDYEGDRLYTDHDTVVLERASFNSQPAGSIGFEFSLTQPPQFIEGDNGFGKSGQWKVAGKFSTSNVLRSVEIAGLKALIAAAA